MSAVTHGYIAGENPLLPFNPNIIIAPSLDDPSSEASFAAVPTATSSADGFALFLTQVCIILSLCLLLGQAFRRIGQPAVVGELLAGVLLGPTAFGSKHFFVEDTSRNACSC